MNAEQLRRVDPFIQFHIQIHQYIGTDTRIKTTFIIFLDKDIIKRPGRGDVSGINQYAFKNSLFPLIFKFYSKFNEA
jgi:hypothetical protein